MKLKTKNKDVYIITGVAGFIGSTLLSELIKRKKCIIIGIDNFRLGKFEFIKNFTKNKKFIFLKINLNKKIKNNKILKILKRNRLKQIWHLAANSDIQSSAINTFADLKNTFLVTANICNFLKPFIEKKTILIFSSSSAIYGNIKGRISESSSPHMPESYYGAMKLASESFISAFSFNNSIKSFIFRFPNVVGKNLTHGIIYDLSKKIMTKNKHLKVLGNGQQRKPYSHVNEIIKCMIYVIKKKHNKKVNYYNIGTNDSGIKVKNIVHLLLKKFRRNKKILYEKSDRGWKGDIPYYKYSTKKLNKTGFKFHLNSYLSIKKAIKDY
jgi:UDP-glucose 4-epimerase